MQEPLHEQLWHKPYLEYLKILMKDLEHDILKFKNLARS